MPPTPEAKAGLTIELRRVEDDRLIGQLQVAALGEVPHPGHWLTHGDGSYLVLQRRHRLARLFHLGEIDVGRDEADLRVAGIDQHLTPRSDGDGMTVGLAIGALVRADLRRREHEATGLDGAGAHQHVPVRLSRRHGEGRRDREHRRTGMREIAVQVGEAQVIADGHADLGVGRSDHHRVGDEALDRASAQRVEEVEPPLGDGDDEIRRPRPAGLEDALDDRPLERPVRDLPARVDGHQVGVRMHLAVVQGREEQVGHADGPAHDRGGVERRGRMRAGWPVLAEGAFPG